MLMTTKAHQLAITTAHNAKAFGWCDSERKAIVQLTNCLMERKTMLINTILNLLVLTVALEDEVEEQPVIEDPIFGVTLAKMEERSILQKSSC